MARWSPIPARARTASILAAGSVRGGAREGCDRPVSTQGGKGPRGPPAPVAIGSPQNLKKPGERSLAESSQARDGVLRPRLVAGGQIGQERAEIRLQHRLVFGGWDRQVGLGNRGPLVAGLDQHHGDVLEAG